MLNYSFIIKNERIKQNMTQKTLALGICSTSYLSKIEKEHVIPKKSIQDKLLKRLNINIHLMRVSEEQQFLNELKNAWQQVIFINNMDHAQIAWNHFNQFNIEFTKLEDFYLCNLYLQRIATIARKSLLETDEIEQAFTSVLHSLTFQQQFIYYINCGHHNLVNKNYNKSIECIKNAQNLYDAHQEHIDSWLIGDFHLLSSEIYYAIFQYSQATTLANKAIKLFEELNLETPLINAYIHLGVIYNRTEYLNEAYQMFENAYKIALKYEKKEFYGKILQNLGYTASLLEDSKKALAYYKKSMSYKYALESKLLVIHSMIKEYSKLNQVTLLNKWSTKGLHLLNESSIQPRLKIYYYHFKIYRIVHEIDDLDEQLIVDALTYFKLHHDYLHLQKYTYSIAQVYMSKNDFEKSTLYFKCSSEIGFKIQSRKNWQDL